LRRLGRGGLRLQRDHRVSVDGERGAHLTRSVSGSSRNGSWTNERLGHVLYDDDVWGGVRPAVLHPTLSAPGSVKRELASMPAGPTLISTLGCAATRWLRSHRGRRWSAGGPAR
jgi:hypothetical protein